MNSQIIFIPLHTELYNEFVLRYGDSKADVASAIGNLVQDFLERTKDEQYWSQQYLTRRDTERTVEGVSGDPDKGYQWLNVFLPNGTRLKMAYKGRDHYAEVAYEKIMYEGEAFSPSGLANRIASGTSRNAWRDLWIKRPRDKEWVLADDLRRNRA